MYKDPSGITPIPPFHLVKISRRHFCWKSQMNWQALNNFTADSTTGWKTKTKPSTNQLYMAVVLHGNGIHVKTKWAKRARLKGRRGTTQKKWIFCIEVAFTQGVCLASLGERSQPDVCGGSRNSHKQRAPLSSPVRPLRGEPMWLLHYPLATLLEFSVCLQPACSLWTRLRSRQEKGQRKKMKEFLVLLLMAYTHACLMRLAWETGK